MFLIDIIPEQFHFIICKSDMPLLYFLDLLTVSSVRLKVLE